MNKSIEHSIEINATPAKVWQAITDKEIIRQYMFGTETLSDWTKGAPLTYSGNYDGHEYKDGGIILEIEPEKILKHTYWSSMSGIEDVPENYAIITYAIKYNGVTTILTVTQENSPTKQMHENSDKHWPMVLKSIKEILEQ